MKKRKTKLDLTYHSHAAKAVKGEKMKLNLSKNVKGALYLAGGVIAFLYINGFFQESLYYLMLAGSIAAITYGFVVTDLWDKTTEAIDDLKSKNNNSGS